MRFQTSNASHLVLFSLLPILFAPIIECQSDCGTNQNPYCAGNSQFEAICCPYPNVCYWEDRLGQPACCPAGQSCASAGGSGPPILSPQPTTITSMPPTTSQTTTSLSTTTITISHSSPTLVTTTINGIVTVTSPATITVTTGGLVNGATSTVVGAFSTVTSAVASVATSVASTAVNVIFDGSATPSSIPTIWFFLTIASAFLFGFLLV